MTVRVLMAASKYHIGDTILITPALRYIDRQLGGIRLTLMGGSGAGDVIDGCPYVEDARAREGRGIRGVLSLARRAREGAFDGFIDLSRSSWRSVVPAALAGVPVRASFSGNARTFLLTHSVPCDARRHIIDRHLDLARAFVGAFGVDHKPENEVAFRRTELWVRSAELLEARELLSRRGVNLDRPFVGVNAGAQERPSSREWRPERFAAAAGRIADSIGGTVVLLGSAPQRDVGDRVASLLSCPVVNLCGQTSIRQAIAIASMARLWIGNDGGLLHVAAAVCPAVVGIFEPQTATRWGYHTPTCRSLFSTTVDPTPPATGGEAFDRWAREALDSVSVEEVLAVAFETMADVRVEGARSEQTADVHASS